MMTAVELTHHKQLGDLIEINDQALSAIMVSGIELDSRQITVGDVFLACIGTTVDGRDYIDQAIAAGAVAVLAEQDDQWISDSYRNGIPIVVVANLAQKVSGIAGEFLVTRHSNYPYWQLPVPMAKPVAPSC